jgi:hypothetical protein
MSNETCYDADLSCPLPPIAAFGKRTSCEGYTFPGIGEALLPAVSITLEKGGYRYLVRKNTVRYLTVSKF